MVLQTGEARPWKSQCLSWHLYAIQELQLSAPGEEKKMEPGVGQHVLGNAITQDDQHSIESQRNHLQLSQCVWRLVVKLGTSDFGQEILSVFFHIRLYRISCPVSWP